MSKYSTGTPVVSALIKTTITDEEGQTSVKETTVNVGDSITIKYATNPYGETEDRTGSVVGFTGRPLDTKRGAARIIDGVPTYLRDPDGDAFMRTIPESMEIKAIIIAPEEGPAIPCFVDNIVDIDGGDEEGD